MGAAPTSGCQRPPPLTGQEPHLVLTLLPAPLCCPATNPVNALISMPVSRQRPAS